MYKQLYSMIAPLLILNLFTAASAQNKVNLSLPIQSLDSPAGSGSGEPNLYASSDGRVYLSWIEPRGEKTHALRFAVRNGGGWSEPRTITEGDNLLVNWADFPSLVAIPGGVLVAHWLVKGAPGSHAYDINIVRSIDDGKTWSKPVLLHRDGTKTEHGFVSMWPFDVRRAGAIWLDGRNFKENSHEAHGASSNEMTLRYAVIDAKGQVSEDKLLDSRVCDCCQTSATVTSEGPIVVYRDRSEKEIRDISVVRYAKGRWTEPKTLSTDDWEIHGCPVNGPSVSAEGSRVAVAWFTAAKDSPRVKIAFSNDAGASFGQPIPVAEASPIGRVDVVMLHDGSALVSWIEKTAKAGEIRARRIKPDGSRDEAITIAETGAMRASGFPQMVRSKNEIIFAWTQSGATSKVVTAIMRLGQ